MAYALIWIALSAPLALIVGRTIRVMGADETIPASPHLTIVRR